MMKSSIGLTQCIIAIALHSGCATPATAADHAEAPLIKTELERAARTAGMGVGSTNILVTDDVDFGIVVADDLGALTREDLARGVDVAIIAVAEAGSGIDVDLQPGVYTVTVTIGDQGLMTLAPMRGGEPIVLPASVSPDPHPARGPRSFVASDGFDLQFGVYVAGVVISPEAP